MIGNAPIQTLATKDANLDLCHVQPARVLRVVVKLHPTQELGSRAIAQHIVKALSEVRFSGHRAPSEFVAPWRIHP